MVSVGNSPEEVDRYLDALRREVRIYKDLLGGPVIAPTSILVGGGTPSMLSPAQTERFLRGIAEDFDLGNCRQITCETEPTTILGGEGRAKLRAMKDGGATGSVSGSSLDHGILRGTGRLQSAEDARDAFRPLRDAGFESVSIDSIYGYPGSTLEKSVETLEAAAALGVDAYQLYRRASSPMATTGSIMRMYETSPEPLFPPAGRRSYLMKELGVAGLGAERPPGDLEAGVLLRAGDTTRRILHYDMDRLSTSGFCISA